MSAPRDIDGLRSALRDLGEAEANLSELLSQGSVDRLEEAARAAKLSRAALLDLVITLERRRRG